MTTDLKAGALFAGIGGFCLGFEKHGIKTAWAIENEASAVTTYKNNIMYIRLAHLGILHCLLNRLHCFAEDGFAE